MYRQHKSLEPLRRAARLGPCPLGGLQGARLGGEGGGLVKSRPGPGLQGCRGLRNTDLTDTPLEMSPACPPRERLQAAHPLCDLALHLRSLARFCQMSV